MLRRSSACGRRQAAHARWHECCSRPLLHHWTNDWRLHMKVRQVMTADVYTVRPDASIFDIAELMRDEDIGAVPVVEDEKLIGMVTDRDIVVRALADSRDVSQANARSVMSGNLLYCFDDQSVEEVLDNMGEQQVRRMPVVDRDKRLVGVVSIGDLSAAAPPDRSGESLSQISQPTHH
jgi:CBS domain-containing protein